MQVAVEEVHLLVEVLELVELVEVVEVETTHLVKQDNQELQI
jgi:hypothetical protein